MDIQKKLINTFFIRSNGKFIRIDTREIRYLESLKNYVRFVNTTRSYMALISLVQLEAELPASQFCRVHRSYIVSIPHILSFDHEAVYLDDKIIPIGQMYKSALQSKVRVLASGVRSRIGAEN